MERARDLTRRDAIQRLTTGALALPMLGGRSELEAWLTGILGPAYAATYFNRNIPDEAHTQMGKLAPDGLSTFSFTPSNGWVITTLKGRRFARNIPGACYNQLLQYLSDGHRIQVLAFPPQGGNSWLIVTDRTVSSTGIPSECASKITEFRNQRRQVLSVAFPPAGGNRWVVVANGAFFARNIPDECYQIMRNLSQRPRPGAAVPRQIHQVSFTPSGGWSVLADDYIFGRNIPDECWDRMKTFRSQGRRIDNVAFSPERGGWSIVSNGGAGSAPRDEIRTFESSIVRGSVTESIWERMRWSNVPGVAVACVIGNRLAWSCGYGQLEAGRDPAAHPESVFQAASVSKVFAAMGAMALVRRGDLQLTDDIRDHLSWTVPVSVQGRIPAPTLELLLSHRAGFNVSGFGGYPAGRSLPTLDEILAGTSSRRGVTVNSAAIQLTMTPGTFSYSGGGYQVLQKLIEDLTSRSFETWMASTILAPFGMGDSSFNTVVSTAELQGNNVASGHDASGRVITGRRNQYPEAAAAGLYTTSEDLARMIMAINRIAGGQTRSGDPLRPAEVTDMLTRRASGYGLGFRVNGGDPTAAGFRYSHGGTNAGFKALFYGYPNRDGGSGVVVMSNGAGRAIGTDGGRNFRTAIADAVAAAYGW